MIDSGSALNLISEKLVNKLRSTLLQLKIMPYIISEHTKGFSMYGLTGDAMKACGSVYIPFLLNGHKFTVDFLIVPTLPTDALLGTPALHLNGLIIDYKQKLLLSSINSHFSCPLSFTLTASHYKMFASLSNAINIPAQSECLIPIQLPKAKLLHATDLQLEPTSNFLPRGCLVASCVITKSNPCILVANTSNRSFLLPKNLQIAEVIPLLPTSIATTSLCVSDESSDYTDRSVLKQRQVFMVQPFDTEETDKQQNNITPDYYNHSCNSNTASDKSTTSNTNTQSFERNAEAGNTIFHSTALNAEGLPVELDLSHARKLLNDTQFESLKQLIRDFIDIFQKPKYMGQAIDRHT